MILDKLSKKIQDTLSKCSQLAFEHEIKIYLVGGVVRDLLLNKKTLDIDICLEFDAVEFAKLLSQKYNAEIIQIQQDLRTAKVKFKNNVVLDLASTRCEIYPDASHLPVISKLYCPLKDDIQRRDFTLNAIAISIMQNNYGEIIDYTGGEKDLKDKKLRILQDNSFIDDPSRIIRAFKYALRLNMEPEDKTLHFMKEYLDNCPKSICYSRIMSEIKLVFRENKSGVLKKFYEWNLEKLFALPKSKAKIDLNYAFKKLGIEKNAFAYFAFILCQGSKEDTQNKLTVLNLDNKEKKIILDYFELKNSQNQKDCLKLYNKFLNKEPTSLAIYYSMTKNKDVLKYKYELEKIKLLITGDDIIKLGVNPSKQYKTIFNAVLKEKLEGKLSSKKDELDFVKHYLNKCNKNN